MFAYYLKVGKYCHIISCHVFIGILLVLTKNKDHHYLQSCSSIKWYCYDTHNGGIKWSTVKHTPRCVCHVEKTEWKVNTMIQYRCVKWLGFLRVILEMPCKFCFISIFEGWKWAAICKTNLLLCWFDVLRYLTLKDAHTLLFLWVCHISAFWFLHSLFSITYVPSLFVFINKRLDKWVE